MQFDTVVNCIGYGQQSLLGQDDYEDVNNFAKAFDKQPFDEQHFDEQHFDEPFNELLDVNLVKAHEDVDKKKSTQNTSKSRLMIVVGQDKFGALSEIF